MEHKYVYSYVKSLGRPVFTTREAASISGRSLSAATQALDHLVRQGIIYKVCRGVWADAGATTVSPYTVIPFLFPRHRAYVSFVSALHMHGIIEQIPQVITLASTAHTRTVRTKVGTFSVHQIAPSFFDGFDWYRGTGSFLIAEPEKALIDSLYLSACKKRQFGHFPEMRFPRSFSFPRALRWARSIRNQAIRVHVIDALSRFPLKTS